MTIFLEKRLSQISFSKIISKKSDLCPHEICFTLRDISHTQSQTKREQGEGRRHLLLLPVLPLHLLKSMAENMMSIGMFTHKIGKAVRNHHLAEQQCPPVR
jgi:hypothetical protein